MKVKLNEGVAVRLSRNALMAIWLFSMANAYGQLSPANDPTWQLQINESDEFNYPNGLLPLVPSVSKALTTDKWYSEEFGAYAQPWKEDHCIIENPTGTNGALKFIITGANTYLGPPNGIPVQNNRDTWWFNNVLPQNQWEVGGIYSNPWHLDANNQHVPIVFTFGYFEIYAKLPGYKSSNIYPSNITDSYNYTTAGLSPLWWFAGAHGTTCPTACVKEEVDVNEHLSWAYGDVRPNTIATHWHHKMCDDGGKCVDSHQAEPYYVHNYHPQLGENTDVDVVNQYHKYGFEWASDRLIFYFDDQPYSVNYNVPGIPQTPMPMWLSMVVRTQIDNAALTLNLPQSIEKETLLEPTAPLPQVYDPNSTMRFEIDYFRYYKRAINNCQVDYAIDTNTDLANFPAEVRADVTTGYNGQVVMNANSTQLIRHSGDFYASDFEVPLGCDLTIIHTPCN